jgi:hypothetical protein
VRICDSNILSQNLVAIDGNEDRNNTTHQADSSRIVDLGVDRIHKFLIKEEFIDD